MYCIILYYIWVHVILYFQGSKFGRRDCRLNEKMGRGESDLLAKDGEVSQMCMGARRTPAEAKRHLEKHCQKLKQRYNIAIVSESVSSRPTWSKMSRGGEVGAQLEMDSLA